MKHDGEERPVALMTKDSTHESEPRGGAVPEHDRVAGFWVRFSAMWIDCTVILFLTSSFVALCLHFGTYVPFEITALVLYLSYGLIGIRWRGRTLGKVICGLTVKSKSGGRVGWVRAFVREVPAKAIAGIIFLLGFVWVGFSKSKRGWHDLLARTTVVQEPRAIGRTRVAVTLVLLVTALFVGRYGYEVYGLLSAARQMAAPSFTAPYPPGRDPATLIEVSSLGEDARARMAEWLKANGETPIDYAVRVASRHQLIIFGEQHHIRENLEYVNAVIPELYHKAGVRVVALEACLAQDNEKLYELVTAEQFDRDLALEIARHHPWKDWGFKGYWDVLETVWRLNSALPSHAKRMRVIGIDVPLDLPSFALTGMAKEDIGVGGGKWWEMLRWVRMPGFFLKASLRDQLMAVNIERETLEKGEKGIVLIGAAHSFLRYRQWPNAPRMGAMLHAKYGDKVFQIMLHDKFWGPRIARLIEEYPSPLGFDVADSPFAMLRDSGGHLYRQQPTVCFKDVAAGYVMLKPLGSLHKCDWLKGYIDTRMFASYKPFYELKLHRSLQGAEEADRGMRDMYAR